MLTLTLLVSFLVSVLGQEEFAHVVLYERPDQRGDYRLLHDATPNLSLIKFNNITSSICVNKGFYIFYTHPNFNSNSDGMVMWAWACDEHCFNTKPSYEDQISSLRPVGDVYDRGQSTLNIYQWDYFEGRQQTYYHHASTLEHDKKIRSIIVTGSLPWTLYKDANFEGCAVCVFPVDDRTPGVYKTESSLGDFADGVSSVRKGCHATDNLYPDNKDFANGLNFGVESSHP